MTSELLFRQNWYVAMTLFKKCLCFFECVWLGYAVMLGW